MKKGFTLIELLAVITVLSLISLAIIPAIIKQVSKKTQEIDSTTTSIIYKATGLYLSNDSNYRKQAGYKYCVKLEDLVKEDLLDKKVTNFKNGKQIPLNRVIQVYVNSYNEYEYKLLGEKENCVEVLYDSRIEGCEGCVFAYRKINIATFEGTWYYMDGTHQSNGTEVQHQQTALTDASLYTTNYKQLGKNYFLGLKLNETTKKIEKAYACGIKDGEAFCIEGKSGNYQSTKNKLNVIYGAYDANTNKGCSEQDSNLSCLGSINAQAFGSGQVLVGDSTAACGVSETGSIGCVED